MIRIAVLASGSGTNLQAILDACAAGRIDGRVEVVVSNVPGAQALERARPALSVGTEESHTDHELPLAHAQADFKHKNGP